MRQKNCKRNRVIFAILILLLACVKFSCKTITTRTYNLQTPLLAERSRIVIALVADLHNTIHGEDQSVLIDKIKDSNPDLILLAGDIFDIRKPMTGSRLLLAGISGIAPVFYVTGNHEYFGYNIWTIHRELNSYGVTVLSDDYVKLEINNNEIILAGIEDPYKELFMNPNYDQSASMERAFRELDDIPLYKILLTHRPENINEYKNFSFDLILSGHAHGGQVRFPPFINGLYAPNQGLFPKYAGGLYRHANVTHIVSRGLSVFRGIPRIFNPPELVIIVIEPEM